MQGMATYSLGSVSYQVKVDKDCVVVSCSGQEMYQLTRKENGEVSLAAFETSVAAKRFFASNKDYFFTKLF